MTATDKQRVQDLLNSLPDEQVGAAIRYLEALVALTPDAPVYPEEDEEISEEEEQAAARAREWYKHNEGIPFEQVVAELGFTMEQVRGGRLEPGE